MTKRDQAEEQPAEEREDSGGQHGFAAYGHIGQSRNLRRTFARNHPYRAPREDQSGKATRACEKDGLGHELAHQPGARHSERRPDGNFLGTLAAPEQQHVCHIATGDQEQRDHAGPQGEQYRPHGAQKYIAQPCHFASGLVVFLGMLLFDSRDQAAELV